MDYPIDHEQDVFFYSTHDYGMNWSLINGLASPLVLKSRVTINKKALTEACYGYGTVAQGDLASVSLVSPSTWWVLRSGPTGDTERFLISGDSVATFTTKFLPATTGRAVLQAAGYMKAVLTLPTLSEDGANYFRLYVTVDGGATWYAVIVPSVHLRAFTEEFGTGGILKP